MFNQNYQLGSDGESYFKSMLPVDCFLFFYGTTKSQFNFRPLNFWVVKIQVQFIRISNKECGLKSLTENNENIRLTTDS